jgi:hypothetical protein
METNFDNTIDLSQLECIPTKSTIATVNEYI